MATLISAKPRGKFRPMRGDVPKRKVMFGNLVGHIEAEFFPYGEKIPGEVILSAPGNQCRTNRPTRSGIGTAHHLRRCPVTIKPIHGLRPNPKRLGSIIKLITDRFPDSGKPRKEFNYVRAVMWVGDAIKLRDLMLSCKVEW